MILAGCRPSRNTGGTIELLGKTYYSHGFVKNEGKETEEEIL